MKLQTRAGRKQHRQIGPKWRYGRRQTRLTSEEKAGDAERRDDCRKRANECLERLSTFLCFHRYFRIQSIIKGCTTSERHDTPLARPVNRHLLDLADAEPVQNSVGRLLCSSDLARVSFPKQALCQSPPAVAVVPKDMLWPTPNTIMRASVKPYALLRPILSPSLKHSRKVRRLDIQTRMASQDT